MLLLLQIRIKSRNLREDLIQSRTGKPMFEVTGYYKKDYVAANDRNRVHSLLL